MMPFAPHMNWINLLPLNQASKPPKTLPSPTNITRALHINKHTHKPNKQILCFFYVRITISLKQRKKKEINLGLLNNFVIRENDGTGFGLLGPRQRLLVIVDNSDWKVRIDITATQSCKVISLVNASISFW